MDDLKAKNKKVWPIALTMAAFLFAIFINLIASEVLKFKALSYFWFIVPLCILSGFITLIQFRPSISYKVILLYFVISTYSVLIPILGATAEMKISIFTMVYSIILLVGTTFLKTRDYNLFSIYLLVFGGGILLFQGGEQGKIDKASILIILSVLFTFPFLNFYLNKIKGDLKEKIKNSEDMTNRLQELVKTMTNEVQIQNKDLKVILSNVDHGFLIINQKSIVCGEITTVTEKIFGMNPKGKKISEVLKFDENENKNFERWMDHVYRAKISFNDILDLAPKTFSKIEGSMVSLDFRPLYKNNEKKVIDKIICIATDIKGKVFLKKKALKEKSKLFSILKIIDKPMAFLDLITDAEDKLANYIDVSLEGMEIEDMYRDFHTLKARFAIYKIDEVVKQIHELETNLNREKEKGKKIRKETRELTFLLENINREVRFFLKENRKIIELVNSNIQVTEDFKETVELKKEVVSFVNTFHKRFVLKNVADFFNVFEEPFNELATTQDKKAKLEIGKTNILINPEKYNEVFSSFIHIFRNAVDHGIETPQDRFLKGKEKLANVNVSFLETHSGGRFRITIKDDGRGLELEKIRKVAVKKGFVSEEDSLNLSDYQIGNYIFQPGFSSKETTTKVSGRGVGMDVVKMEVQKIGGNIIAESNEGKGVTITIDLPIFR